MSGPLNRRKMLAVLAGGAAAAAGLLAADLAQAPTERAPTVTARRPGTTRRGDRTLIAFYSKTGRNYPDLQLSVGNTARVAEAIARRIPEAATFEIETAEPYPADYDQTVDLAEIEERRPVWRPLARRLPRPEQYGTVLLGYPIWWSEQPMVVQTFMRDHDLDGARIIPFCTHEGSGFGNSIDVLRTAYPSARIEEGLARQGQQAYRDPAGTRSAVDSWLGGLGL